MKILVVDDEMHTREICCDFLIEAGYEVDSAENGVEALEFLAKSSYGILLTDIQMPKMDGISLLKESRRLYPDVEVILMTAYGGLPSAIEAIRSGSYDYLTKPLSRDFLLNTVRRCEEKIHLHDEIKKFQRRLIEQEKLAALGSVSAWLSHRMRNALSVISMCAHYLKNKSFGEQSAEMNEVISAIIDKAKTIEKVTADLISFSRAYDLQPSIESVNDIIDEVLESNSVQFQIQKVQLDKKMDTQIPKVRCDPHLLHEVFENIIVNALQAIGQHKEEKLIIRTHFEPLASPQPGRIKRGDVIASISNTGSHIPKDIREKIFTPFFTTKESGSGLGLAIVKRIVEQHGGKVFAESEEQSAGKITTIGVSLPVMEDNKTQDSG